jgi:hypothetical protein
MHAQPGDWLIVEKSFGSGTRRALIEEVTGDGNPPFRVRWLDTGEEAFVYPLGEAKVQTHEERANAEALAQERAAAIQRQIRARQGQP